MISISLSNCCFTASIIRDADPSKEQEGNELHIYNTIDGPTYEIVEKGKSMGIIATEPQCTLNFFHVLASGAQQEKRPAASGKEKKIALEACPAYLPVSTGNKTKTAAGGQKNSFLASIHPC